MRCHDYGVSSVNKNSVTSVSSLPNDIDLSPDISSGLAKRAKSQINIKNKAKSRITHRWWFLLIVILLSVLIAAQAVTFVAYDGIFKTNFTSPFDDDYTTLEDYPFMEMEAVTFESNNGQTLYGGFYKSRLVENPTALVIVNHGFGGGYAWYLPQVAYLAQNNFLVLAFDKTGNDQSKADGVRGLPQGILDLKYALSYVRGLDKTKDLPIMLYGHSWGGYSSCAILEEETDILAVASLSSFNSSLDMLVEQGCILFGDYMQLAAPFLWVCDFMRFGEYATYSSLDGLAATDTEVLLFHSNDDSTIPINESLTLYKNELSQKENLHFVEMTGKKHDVYFSDEATAYRVNARKELAKLKDENGEVSEEAYAAFLETHDRLAANTLDEDVMQQIIAFYNKALKKANREDTTE